MALGPITSAAGYCEVQLFLIWVISDPFWSLLKFKLFFVIYPSIGVVTGKLLSICHCMEESRTRRGHVGDELALFKSHLCGPAVVSHLVCFAQYTLEWKFVWNFPLSEIFPYTLWVSVKYVLVLSQADTVGMPIWTSACYFIVTYGCTSATTISRSRAALTSEFRVDQVKWAYQYQSSAADYPRTSTH